MHCRHVIEVRKGRREGSVGHRRMAAQIHQAAARAEFGRRSRVHHTLNAVKHTRAEAHDARLKRGEQGTAIQPGHADCGARGLYHKLTVKADGGNHDRS